MDGERILILEWQRIALIKEEKNQRVVYAAGEILYVQDTYDEIVEKIEEVY